MKSKFRKVINYSIGLGCLTYIGLFGSYYISPIFDPIPEEVGIREEAYDLGRKYIFGQYPIANNEKAYNYFNQAKNLGSTEAKAFLAQLYAENTTLHLSENEALSFANDAMNSNEQARALYATALIHLMNEKYSQAETYLLKSSNLDFIPAQLKLTDYYQDISPDREKWLYWVSKLAQTAEKENEANHILEIILPKRIAQWYLR